MRSLVVCASLLLASPAFAAPFVLKSKDAGPHGMLGKRFEYDGFGCHGENRSPELHWSGAPAGTRSFVLTIFDRSAVRLTKSGWWHWVMFNIPASVHALRQDAGNPGSGLAPQGSGEGLTDYGTIGYGGPCPPQGDPAHEYVVTLYALKTRLPVQGRVTGAQITYMARHGAIARAHLVLRYRR